MLNEKNWPPEAVVRLLIWIFASVCAGMLAVSLAFPNAKDAAADRRIWSMILGTLAFHGSGIVCVGCFTRSVGMTWHEAFGIGVKGLPRAIGLGLLACGAILPIALGLGQLSAWAMQSVQVEPVPQPSVRAIQAVTSLPLKIYFGVVAIVVAPLAEELIFRGVLYPTIKQRGYPRLALWGVSLFFAATHANVMTFIPLTILAVALTKLYEHTGNLLAPITTHSLFNLANFLWLLLNFEPAF
ncbi:MAG TPA: CPBP family intramembrane glutamic endopeptidase [Verrucomicrobiae bacterium]